MNKYLILVIFGFSLTGCTLLTNSLGDSGIAIVPKNPVISTKPNLDKEETLTLSPEKIEDTQVETPAINTPKVNDDIYVASSDQDILDNSEVEADNLAINNTTEGNADIYVSTWGKDILNDDLAVETKMTTETETIFVATNGRDELQQSKSIDLTDATLLYVSQKGEDNPITKENKNGSNNKPFRSLTFAIKQAQRLQAVDSSKIVSIEIESGTYSSSSGEDSPIQIPPGITITGRGKNTVIISGINLNENNELSNLQIKDSFININGNDVNDQGIKISQLTMVGSYLTINQSSPTISDITFDGGTGTYNNNYNNNNGYSLITIDSANPIISNLKITNVEEQALFIAGNSAPNLTNIEISNNRLGIKNNSNTTINNLIIDNNQYGIVNYGEMTITNLTLTNNKSAGICNHENGTILINNAQFDNEEVVTAAQCPSSEEEPIMIPDIAGEIEGVIIE
jgi:hypothetical protein